MTELTPLIDEPAPALGDDTYSSADLARVARCAADWDVRYYRPRPTRIETTLRHEFRLYLQYMLTRQETDPLDPTPEALRRWMAPSRGFDVENVRRHIHRRLYEITGSDVFLAEACAPGSTLRYPDRRHVVCWHNYHRAVAEQSRPCFEQITTPDVVDAELKSWPYYAAMSLADGEHAHLAESNAGGGYNAFVESDRAVVDLVARRASPRETGQPLRVLEFGCADGRLLIELGRRFPHSELIGTNLLGERGFLPEAVSDPRIRVVTDSVEETTLEPASFDVIVSTEVIEHLVDPAAMVRQIRRLLRPGGIFVVTAPSLHVQFLSRNPLTYFMSLASVVSDRVLPPFHNLYEPLTDLPLVHYAFSWQSFRRMFRAQLPQADVRTMRFYHLRKFRLDGIAARLPLLRHFGGLLVAYGCK